MVNCSFCLNNVIHCVDMTSWTLPLCQLISDIKFFQYFLYTAIFILCLSWFPTFICQAVSCKILSCIGYLFLSRYPDTLSKFVKFNTKHDVTWRCLFETAIFIVGVKSNEVVNLCVVVITQLYKNWAVFRRYLDFCILTGLSRCADTLCY